jgi:hypothetical protein
MAKGRIGMSNIEISEQLSVLVDWKRGETHLCVDGGSKGEVEIDDCA